MEPLPPSPVRRRRVRRFVIIAIVALLVFALLLIVLVPSDSQVTWLTPAELAHATKPSPFVTTKRKLINLTAPLWRWYHSSRRSIQISSVFLTLPTTTSEQSSLGTATTTNADGLRAWILSPAELDALRQRLKTLPGASVDAAPTIQTADGNQAQISMGQSINMAGRYVPAGLAINVLPRAASHSVKLLLNATLTEISGPPPATDHDHTVWSASAIIIKTNFAATCSAVVPNNGGLVLDSGNPGGTNAQTYWLILSPMMLDPNGNPIKP